MRWFSTPPAAARVVPRPLKKMDGGGETEESLVAHSALSLEIMGCSFALVFEGSRRARACTLEMEGSERRVVRICEPCVALSACAPSVSLHDLGNG